MPQVQQEVAVFAEGVAERVFAEGRERVADCAGFTEEGVTFELAPLSFPALGDESFAARVRHHALEVEALDLAHLREPAREGGEEEER